MDHPPPADARPNRSAWPANALPCGTELHGYRIREVLGQGGFGITYLASDLLDQSFAIKEFFPRQLATRSGVEVIASTEDDRELFDDCRERFLGEARVLLRLSRLQQAAESIVHVHTFFETNRTAYLVMDFVRGENLDDVLRNAGGTLAEPRLRGILRGLLAGLHLVHEAGVVHRDIKPANIIIRTDGQPILIDFGASRDLRPDQTSNFTQIYSGAYTPPEQFYGQRLGPFSDLYAVGAVAYRCIGGTLAGAASRQAAAAGGDADPMVSACVVGHGRYAPAMLAAIDRALTVDPRLRPQSADQMVAEVAGEIAAPAAAGFPPFPAAAKSRSPSRTAMLAAALLILGGTATIAWFATPRAPSAPTSQASLLLAPPAPRAAPDEAPISAPASREALAPPLEPPATVPSPAVVAPEPTAPPTAGQVPASEALPSQASPIQTAQVEPTAPCFGATLIPIARDARSPGFCAVLDGLANAIGRRGQADGNLILSIARAAPRVGLRLHPTASGGADATILLDLFAPDGGVQHLHARFRDGSWGAFLVPDAAGPRLLVATELPAGPDAVAALRLRPDTEPAAAYLAALTETLRDQPTARAQALPLTIQPALPAPVVAPVAPPPVPTAVARRSAPSKAGELSSARCARIVEQAQLGDRLSDADLSALRGECRR